MNKKEMMIPFVLVGLAVAFGLVSAMVILSRGHPGWIKRKLKIGGMILSLTATLNGCGTEPTMTCYVVVPINEFSLVDEQDIALPQEITVDLTTNPVLRGRLRNREATSFVYRIVDKNQTQVQGGLLQALDGAWDEYREEFEIVLDTNLVTDTYHLQLAVGDDPAIIGMPSEYLLHIQNE